MDKNKILAESTKVAQEAAKMIGGTFEQGVGFKPGAPVENTRGMSGGSSSIMSRLEERLLGSSEGISSSYSEIENAISGAIGAQEGMRAAGERRIQGDYAAERDYMIGENQAVMDTALENRRGYGTQVAALRRLTETTDKNMRDLEVRRQDALLANDAQAASQIASLQMKQLEFKQQKEQEFYNNAFQLAGLSLQQTAQDRAKQEFTDRMAFDKEQRTFDRQDKMASLAAQAGVAYDATDTFETLSVKIAAIADEERRLKAQERLDKLAGDVKKEDDNFVFDDILSNAIADGKTAVQAANDVVKTMREVGQLLSRDEYNKILVKAQELEAEYKKTKAMKEAETGGNFISRFFSGRSTPMSQNDMPMNMRSGIQTDPRQVAIESYFTGAPIY